MSRSKAAKQRRNQAKNLKRKAQKNNPLYQMLLKREIRICLVMEFIHKEDVVCFPMLQYYEAKNGIEGCWVIRHSTLVEEQLYDDEDFLGCYSKTYIGSDPIASLAHDYVCEKMSFRCMKIFI